MTYRSPSVDVRRRRLPSRDHEMGTRPFDGPMMIRLPGWWGSAATIWEPSLYVMHPWTRANLSDDCVASGTQSSAGGPGFTGVGCAYSDRTARSPATIAIAR